MKKYMLLNMLMVFGVMQMGNLFCMNKLTKLNRATHVFKPTNMNKTIKSKFCNYSCDSGLWSKVKVPVIGGAILLSMVSLYSVNKYYPEYSLFKGIVREEEDPKKKRKKDEYDVERMMINLRYILKKKPKRIDKARIILNQKKLVDYIEEDGVCTWGNRYEFENIILEAIHENNQPMVRLFQEKGFRLEDRHLFYFMRKSYKHKDAEGMAKLLVNWPNSEGVFYHYCFNENEVYQFGYRGKNHLLNRCSTVSNGPFFRDFEPKAFKIVVKEAERAKENHIRSLENEKNRNEKIKHDDFNKYITSLQNSSNN